MKFHFVNIFLPLLICVPLINACGGGEDDEAGAPTPLAIVPTTVTYTGPRVAVAPASCPPGGTVTTEIFIYGGTAPYRLDNTEPTAVTLNKGVVDHPGQTFRINTIAPGCYGPVLVTVVDSLNRRVTLEVSTVAGEVG